MMIKETPGFLEAIIFFVLCLLKTIKTCFLFVYSLLMKFFVHKKYYSPTYTPEDIISFATEFEQKYVEFTNCDIFDRPKFLYHRKRWFRKKVFAYKLIYKSCVHVGTMYGFTSSSDFYKNKITPHHEVLYTSLIELFSAPSWSHNWKLVNLYTTRYSSEYIVEICLK